jgi:integrase
MAARARGRVVPLRADGDDMAAAAARALDAVGVYLGRCKLAANTVKAYRRQAAAYTAWLARGPEAHPDAFADVVGAEAAVTAWRKQLLTAGAQPASVNQGLAALTLLYEHGANLRIQVSRVRVPRPGEPDALTKTQQGAVERASVRRGVRDAAIIAVLLYAGARVEECARLHLNDVAITARTGRIHLHGKGDQVRDVPLPAIARQRITAWIDHRGTDPGPLWTGQRGPLSISGITQVVLLVGADAGVKGQRPHRLRHTYATRLQVGGADPSQIQALLGHATLETAGRYFRAGPAEQAAVVDRVFRT